MLNIIRLDLFEHYVAVFSFDVDNNRTELRSENGKITWNKYLSIEPKRRRIRFTVIKSCSDKSSNGA